MATERDLAKLVQAQQRAVELAERELSKFLAKVSLDDPELLRDALLQVMPGLVDKYGGVAATAAAEWYGEQRAISVGGNFTTVLGRGKPSEKIQEWARWAVEGFFGEDQDGARDRLSRVLNVGVKQAGRDTIAWNSARDPKAPRFARVPYGAKTCAWCSMLASRGFVYRNAASAGKAASSFHSDCDCQIVPSWKPGDQNIQGYDPEKLYAQYRQAAGRLKAEHPGATLTDESVAALMREMFPKVFTDSLVGH